ncbi:MAG: pantoate--beta-alanine ligase [Actinobacteria bacterium]|nr:pantoate--beta-alanine ligase [Actinomycetota bacterium]
MALALSRAGWEVVPALGRDDDVADAAAGVDLLVIATPDASVVDVAAAVTPSASTVVAHLAGSLGLDVLSAHPRRAALHPLVALPSAEVGADRLRGAWFAVAGDPLVREVVDALGGHALDVRDEDRAAYHAAACIASNHLVALLGQVERVAASAGLPLDAYLDLVRGTVDNVAHLGPAAALTGPVARGDWETVARHLASLDASERPAYEAMADAAFQLSHPTAVSGTPIGYPGTRSGCQNAGVEVIDTIAGFRKALDAQRRAGRTVGLVPTMGYLHDGHASLIRRAAAECDVVAVTVFVNPLQFAANEDLSTYPRDLDGDVRLARESGASFVFAPPLEEMYPGKVLTSVHVSEVSEGLEGASRPTHFDGVATVVAKLFNASGECRAYFGEKDWQQLQVVRAMVRDLSFPVEIVGCPIVREPDGLAMSSRNVYLSPEERVAATVLHRALQAGAADIANARVVMAATVATEPSVDLDYADVVETDSEYRLLIAARVGRTRLIDNQGVAK